MSPDAISVTEANDWSGSAEERRPVPPTWAWAKLGDVCTGPQYGWTTSAAKTGELKLLRTTDISSGSVIWQTVPYCQKLPNDQEKYILNNGDILISRAGSVGKSFLIYRPERSIFASYLVRFRPQINDKYVYFFLQTGAYWQQISDKTAGIAIPNVNASKLKSVAIPIAPFAEQQRIVARIDELFAEIAEGEAALERARRGLDTWRRPPRRHPGETRSLRLAIRPRPANLRHPPRHAVAPRKTRGLGVDDARLPLKPDHERVEGMEAILCG